MGERQGEYRVLVGKPGGKKALRGTRFKWEDIIKIDFHELEWGAWTGLICLRTKTSGGRL
jgi:hypothetical protein